MTDFTVYVASVEHDRYGSVDDADRRRATDAAEAVLRERGVSSDDAHAAYEAQWQELDDEDQMHGAALAWIAARQAADVALTSTWAKPGSEVSCTLRSRP